MKLLKKIGKYVEACAFAAGACIVAAVLAVVAIVPWSLVIGAFLVLLILRLFGLV